METKLFGRKTALKKEKGGCRRKNTNQYSCVCLLSRLILRFYLSFPEAIER